MRFLNKIALPPFLLLSVATARLIGKYEEGYSCLTHKPKKVGFGLIQEIQSSVLTNKRLLTKIKKVEECYSTTQNRVCFGRIEIGKRIFNTTKNCPIGPDDPTECVCWAFVFDREECQSCSVCDNNSFYIDCTNVIPFDDSWCASVDCSGNCGPGWQPKQSTDSNGDPSGIIILSVLLVIVCGPYAVVLCMDRLNPNRRQVQPDGDDAQSKRARQRLIDMCTVTKV